ncbi:acetolactate synthase [Canna indica]|uniref:Acetolactate synthase n=1 Tax=Canna indica TaxID=4628 RepID=A0AAQ3KNB1_9LILI|nr:acetolactate synthase [Canna indica]
MGGKLLRLDFTGDWSRGKGANILVEALEREGVTDLFAYPGGASDEIHQALTRFPSIINHLLRHEQGEVFAAIGNACSTRPPGVCIAEQLIVEKASNFGALGCLL